MSVIKIVEDVSLEEEIFSNYPPDLLDDIYKRYFAGFLEKTNRYFDDWNLDKKEFEGLIIRKREIVRLIAITLSDASIFGAWFERLPYMISKVFETVVWEGKQKVLELNARTKGDILETTDLSRITQENINPAYCLFLLQVPKQSKLDQISPASFDLPLTVRKKCKRYLPKPKGYYLKPLKILEKTDYTFSDQEQALQSINVICEFIKQGNLKTTKNGMPSKHSMSRLLQQTGVNEFYPDATEPALKMIRIELLAFLFSREYDSVIHESSQETFRHLFIRFGEMEEPILIQFLEHIKGWYHASKQLNKNYHAVFINLMRELPPEKWISYKQLARYSHVRDINLFPVTEEASRYLYLSGEWHGWGNTKKPVPVSLFTELILEPLCKANLFLCAAFGLIDIGYNLPAEQVTPQEGFEFYSVFEGLRYIRLTQLGAYVFGLTNVYQVDDSANIKPDIVLDEDRLLLTLSDKDARSEMILDRLAIRIGRLRFRFDFETFLKDCMTPEDVENRIDQFYSIVGSKIPENWHAYLSNLRLKTTSLILQEDYQVFKINPDDDELINLIAEDSELRSLVLLSENYYLIVQNRDLVQLRKRLLIFGYLF